MVDSSPISSPVTVEARSVSRRYHSNTGPVMALERVDFAAERGRLTVIAGESGSGKSTLLGIIACIDRADEGSVLINDLDVQQLSRAQRRAFRRRSLGLVLPAPADNLLHSLDAGANLAWSAHRRRGVRLDADAVAGQLALVGLEAQEPSGPASCRAASSSGWPCSVRSSANRGWCWPMNRPHPSMPHRACG